MRKSWPTIRHRRVRIKRFRFKLEALLRLRKMEENRALADMALVLARVNVEETRKEKSAAESREQLRAMERERHGGFDLESFQMSDRYLTRLESEQDEASRRIEEMRPELDKKRDTVLEFSRKRRVVELLKERQRERYLRERRRKERRELEEVNVRPPLAPHAQKTQEQKWRKTMSKGRTLMRSGNGKGSWMSLLSNWKNSATLKRDESVSVNDLDRKIETFDKLIARWKAERCK